MKKIITSLFGLLSILTCAANTTFINYEIPCDGEVFAEADGLIYYIEQAPFATIVDIADSATDVVIPEKVTINRVEYDVYPKLSKYPIYSYLGIDGYTDAADIYCLVEPPFPDEVLCNGNQTLKSLNTGPITNIEDYFFKNYTALECVTMPDVIDIGVESFRGCTAIENIEVPNVLYLHKSCLRDCVSLKNCVLPSVSDVEPYIFRDCTSIESIIFESPEVVVHEDVYPYSDDDEPYTDGMFAGCTSLRRIVVKGIMTPPYNHEIGIYAGLRADGQRGCSALEELYVNNDMRYTKNMIADAPNLKSITIGNNRITHLEPDAITGCDIHEIHCMFPIPPVRYNPEDEPIEVDKQTCVVYVPRGYLDIYTHADYWSEFANIVEDSDVEPLFDVAYIPKLKIGTDKNNTYGYYPTDSDDAVAIGLTQYQFVNIDSDNEPLFYNYSLYYGTPSNMLEFITPDNPVSINGCDYAVTQIQPYTAAGLNNIKIVAIGEGVTRIGNYAFADSYIGGYNPLDQDYEFESYFIDHDDSLISIELPSTLQHIGKNVLNGAEIKGRIVCRAMTPPALADDRFFTSAEARGDITLNVPAEAVQAYESAPVWCDFRIVGINGLDNVEAEIDDGDVEYYNLQGMRVTPDRAGVYIRRAGGEVTKVMIK